MMIAKRLDEESAQPDTVPPQSVASAETGISSITDTISMEMAHFRLCASDGLLELLHDLKESIDAKPNADVFAGRLKNEFTACHLVLNERFAAGEKEVPAPAFRPQPARSKKPKGNAIELANIVRLIDLHFLLVRRSSCTSEPDL